MVNLVDNITDRLNMFEVGQPTTITSNNNAKQHRLRKKLNEIVVICHMKNTNNLPTIKTGLPTIDRQF